MVSSTEGWSTCTFWKRRSSAASFSMCWRYSSRVVAPTQCSSPRARAGLSMLPASMAPSALPAPTMVCSSSTNRMMRPSCLASSFSTAFKRSSNSPRYLAPAISAAMSRASTRLSLSPSGTSPLTMRWASPSTMAVLPTPGSPISTGLFLVRRCSTWMVRRISSSRPITGSSLPLSARSVRSWVYFFSASILSSALGSVTASPPRTSWIFSASTFFLMPAFLNSLPSSPPSSQAASNSASVDTYWSPRCWASRSARLSSRAKPWDSCTSPLNCPTVGSLSMAIFKAVMTSAGLAPAFSSNGAATPPLCCSSANSKCTGSIALWLWPTARDWASPNASCKRAVNLSIRIFHSPDHA